MIELSAIKGIVAEVLDMEISELRDDVMLVELEDWDSVNAVRLMLHMESELGVRLPVDQMMTAKSLYDLQLAVSKEAAS